MIQGLGDLHDGGEGLNAEPAHRLDSVQLSRSDLEPE
jgi:hypothetical protein